MKKVLLLAVLLLVIPLVHSVGVSPAESRFVFEPNMSREVSFSFRNNLDRNITIIPSLRGELKDYAHYLDPSSIRLVPGKSGAVTVSFQLPESIGAPGWHTIDVIASELEGTGGSVGARGEVIVFIKFFVKYPGKYLSATLDAQDAKMDDDVKFNVYLSNLGDQDINSAGATIEIYDGERQIGQVATDTVPIKIQEDQKLEAKWSSAGTNPGNYWARAVVNYDTNLAYANDTFKIGTFYLKIINFTNRTFAGTINPFDIAIENKWNDDVENIFANVNIMENSQTINTFSVADPIINPWQVKTISGYFDAMKIKPGIYDATIHMTYTSGGKTESTDASGKVEVVEATEKEKREALNESEKQGLAAKGTLFTTTNLLILLIILLVIFNIIIMMRKRKKKNEEIQEDIV